MILAPSLFDGVLGGDVQWDYVVLLCDFEGTDGDTTYTEVSSNAAIGTFSGTGLEISDEQSHYGNTSLKLTGSGVQYVWFPWNADFGPLNQYNWTVELWFYPTSIGTVKTLMGSAVSSSIRGWELIMLTDGTVRWAHNKNGSNLQTITSTGTATANAWNHVALSWYSPRITTDVNRHDGRLFLNGTEEAGWDDDTAGVYYPSANALRVGGEATTGSRTFVGYIDGVRITKGTVVADHMGSGVRYPATSTPGESDFTPATDAWPIGPLGG